jgi:hypothetical protein
MHSRKTFIHNLNRPWPKPRQTFDCKTLFCVCQRNCSYSTAHAQFQLLSPLSFPGNFLSERSLISGETIFLRHPISFTLLPLVKSGRIVKLITDLNLVQTLRMCGRSSPLSIRLHSNVLKDGGNFTSEGARNFSLHHRVQTGSGPTQSHTHCVPGALSLLVKRPGLEVDH